MFLKEVSCCIDNIDLLRTSGDVSSRLSQMNEEMEFAPHERRCFSVFIFIAEMTGICSARAEMFLTFSNSLKTSKNLLRTSGDVSFFRKSHDRIIVFAPHERRCFHYEPITVMSIKFAPHERRCF